MNQYTFDQFTFTVEKESNGNLQAAYIYLPNHPSTDGCAEKTIDVGHGVILDLDANGTLIGIEIIFPLNTNSSK